MADATGSKRRPRTASGSRVNIYLGSDQAARALRNDLETIQTSKRHNSLSETVRFLVEQWRRNNVVCDASTQVVSTSNASTQCSMITDNHHEHPRVHVVTVGSQCLPIQSCTPHHLRDQIQMFNMPFISVTNSPYIPLLQAQRQFNIKSGGSVPLCNGTLKQEAEIHGNVAMTTNQKVSPKDLTLYSGSFREGEREYKATTQDQEQSSNNQSQDEKEQRVNTPTVLVERLSSVKKRAERASITDTTKKALLECIETRKSTYPNPRVRGGRGQKRGCKIMHRHQ